MSDPHKWLSAYKELDEPGLLLNELERLADPITTTDDPSKYLAGLLGKVEQFALSTNRHKDRFVGKLNAEMASFAPNFAVTSILESLAKGDEFDTNELQVLAESFLKTGEVEAAELCAAISFLRGSRTAATLGLLAGKALRESKGEVAAELVKLSEELKPESPETLYSAGRLLLFQGRVEEASAKLAQLLELFPGYLPAWGLQINALTALERWEELLKLLEKAPGQIRNLQTQALEAQALAATGKKTQAVSSFRSLAADQGEDPVAYGELCQRLIQLGAHAEAEELIDAKIGQWQDQSAIYVAAGQLRFEQARDQEAFDILQHAVELDPKRLDALLTLALICFRNNELEMALELASSVTGAADPEHSPRACVLMADILALAGKHNEALEAYSSALALAPKGSVLSGEIEKKVTKLKKK